MRLNRVSWLVPAVLTGLVGACKHDDPVDLIKRDGFSTIPATDLVTAPAGFLAGSRAANRYLASSFDTSITDAFARATTNPPYFRPDPNCGYGSTPLIYAAGATATPTYAPPLRYLPALVGGRIIRDVSGCGTAVDYIVQPGHPGNGGTVWELWYEFDGAASTRYISGLVRYALQQRGALDISEILQTGTATQPDSLVYMAGDFNPGGKKARARFTTNCASVNLQHATAGTNPIWTGSDTTGRISALRVSIDATVSGCAGEVWGNLGTASSPIPSNNAAAALTAGSSHYNFYVIWEALADSTPNYARPIYREQVGPLVTTTGVVVNNSYGPIPTAALSATALGPLPGAISRPDTFKLTAQNIKPLSTGAYQVWLVQKGTDSAQLVTAGRVIRMKSADTTVRDTLTNVSSFNATSTFDIARVEFDMAPFAAVLWNSAVLAVAGSSGATTLPTAQPLWTTAVAKAAGQTATLTGSLLFGSFNKGKTPPGSPLFGAAGTGTGGLFGLELREDLQRLPRPPVGYMYEAWLTNSTDATKLLNLGPILTPYPDLQPLTDADTRQTDPVSGAEVTRAAVRYIGSSIDPFFKQFNRLQIRLTPINGNASVLTPTLVLSGTLGIPTQ